MFKKIGTQWRGNGVLGLDYNVLPFVLELNGVERSLWASLFDDLQVMEQAAISEIKKG